jgi:alpha-1,3-rhamnosyl/mannosyltransferase
VHVVRLGVNIPAATSTPLEALGSVGLSGEVSPGNYSICVGTIQPRKNIERLITAHSVARQRAPELGPLVLVGTRGWGDVDTTGAIVVSDVDDATMNALVHGARVAAYVPIEEGWGLPAVEALAAGRPLVASRAVPSVRGNSWAITVDPTSVDDLAGALVSAVAQDDDESARAARANSVVDLTWANCARDHWAAWS